MKTAAALAALALLAGCGQKAEAPADNTADQLDAAARQSTPEAAAVLHNEADTIAASNSPAPEASAQNALQNAGQASPEPSKLKP